MRLIGYLENENKTLRFSGFLQMKGIAHQVEEESGRGWALWIHSEDQIDEASRLLDAFIQHPEDPIYEEAARESRKKLAQAKKEEEKARGRYIDVRATWSASTRMGFGAFTLVLIGLCVIVALVSNFGKEGPIPPALSIVSYEKTARGIQVYTSLTEIRHGQVWRLFTPILLHFRFLHLLFNMLWLKDLGSLIERRMGTLRFALLVLIIAGLSNVGQYYMSGPFFGGMSGVVYGLLGFIWIRGKFDPRSGYYLPPWIVWMMGIWFVLCLTGLMGPVANTAHGAGLVAGMAAGYLSSGKWKLRSR